jgi:Sec-independent protein translocase protein TatA/uncharacterized protein YukE
MLDNFGMGEFFALAILGLLFFGPERLPQIGAQIGRWVSRMTGYSKAFMTEWRDEALVLHDAVAEVRGIRDELAAARADITSTLDTARSDVNGALAGAKLDVQQQVKGISQAPSGEGTPPTQDAPSLPDKKDEGDAITKTQAILSDLSKKRAVAPASTDRRTTPVGPADLARLHTQVSDLETALSALRQELAQVRVRLRPPAPSANPQEDPVAATDLDSGATAIPIGEAA